MIERLIVRPFANAPVLASVIVFIGLSLIFNSLAGWLYGYSVTIVRLAVHGPAVVRHRLHVGA